MECRLTLVEIKSNRELDIILTESLENNLSFSNEVCGVVHSNMQYRAKIDFEQQIKSIRIYVNDRVRNCYYINGNIYFNDENFLNGRIFLNYFGYVSITIYIETDNGNYKFYSSYLDVAIRKDISSDIVRQMIDYIAENSQKYLFKEDSNIKDFSYIGKSKNKNIYTEVSMLENIVFEYENNFKYFKTGAKYKINNNYIIDNFEKLKEIKNETIQYIISNPQQLIAVNFNTGIKYNKLNLQPKKTLINKNEICYDIYENKVILGFLKYIYNLIVDKIKEVESRTNKPKKYFINGEYISLCNEIYFKISESLNKYKIKLYDIKKKIEKLYFMYREILNCGEINIKNIPKPSYIFMEIRYYRKIYEVIKQWFSGGNYDLEQEKMILTFSEVNQIYEYYVLFKINNYIVENEYSLKSVKKFNYILNPSFKHINTKFENTFVFQKEQTSISVYYQPVISSEQQFNNIGLFRNNNISFDKGECTYYTPDYVIKVTRNGVSQFIILDAKWSTLETVKKYRFKEIAYKYIFSISTIYSTDIVRAVYVVNGQEVENKKDYIYNFFNSNFKNRNIELAPSAKILTLNPNISEITQKEDLNQLLALIRE